MRIVRDHPWSRPSLPEGTGVSKFVPDEFVIFSTQTKRPNLPAVIKDRVQSTQIDCSHPWSHPSLCEGTGVSKFVPDEFVIFSAETKRPAYAGPSDSNVRFCSVFSSLSFDRFIDQLDERHRRRIARSWPQFQDSQIATRSFFEAGTQIRKQLPDRRLIPQTIECKATIGNTIFFGQRDQWFYDAAKFFGLWQGRPDRFMLHQ